MLANQVTAFWIGKLLSRFVRIMHHTVSEQIVVFHMWKGGSVATKEIPFYGIWTVFTF